MKIYYRILWIFDTFTVLLDHIKHHHHHISLAISLMLHIAATWMSQPSNFISKQNALWIHHYLTIVLKKVRHGEKSSFRILKVSRYNDLVLIINPVCVYRMF
jgi:hypothetical protein